MYKNIIIDDLPSSHGGRPVNTDFRQGLKYYRIVEDKGLSDDEKTGLIIRCFFGDSPVRGVELRSIIGFIAWYLSGGTEQEPEEEGGPSGKKKPVFSFNVDAGRLYAAFWECYGINLRKVDLHWWEFLELFWNISSKTRLMEVVDIRGREIPNKASPKEKARLRKAKRLYALDKTESKESNEKTLKNFFDRW